MKVILSTYACGGNGMLSLDNAYQKPIGAADWTQIQPHYMKHEDLDDMDNFDMPSAWYLTPQNAEYLFAKGYEVVINGIKMEINNFDQEMIRVQQLRKVEAEKRRKDAEEKAQLEQEQQQEFTTKSKAMIGDMVQISLYRNDIEIIPDTMIRLRHKIGGMCADRVDHCVKIKIPKLNCDGVEQFWDVYDMETWNYYVPKEIGEKINTNAFLEEIKTPSSYLVETVLNIQGHSEFQSYSKNPLLIQPEIQTQIIENYKKSMIRTEPTSKELEWLQAQLYWVNGEDKICELLGIKSQVEDAWKQIQAKLDTIKIEANKKIVADQEQKRIENAKKYQEYTDRKAKLTADLQQLTKNQLVEKYKSTVNFKPSWGKAKVIEEIVKNEVKK